MGEVLFDPKLLRFKSAEERLLGFEKRKQIEETFPEFYEDIRKTLERRTRMGRQLSKEGVREYSAFLDTFTYVDLRHWEREIGDIFQKHKNGQEITEADFETVDFAVSEALKSGTFDPEKANRYAKNYFKRSHEIDTYYKLVNFLTNADEVVLNAIRNMGKRPHMQEILQKPELVGDVEKYMQKCDEFGGLEYVEGIADGLGHGFPLQSGESVLMDIPKEMLVDGKGKAVTGKRINIDVTKHKKLIKFIETERKALIEKIAETAFPQKRK